MITFLAGVSAAIAVGMLIWLAVDTTKALKRVKLLREEGEKSRLELQYRLDNIDRALENIVTELNRRIDENYSYTDSRLDKLESKFIENRQVKKAIPNKK